LRHLDKICDINNPLEVKRVIANIVRFHLVDERAIDRFVTGIDQCSKKNRASVIAANMPSTTLELVLMVFPDQPEISLVWEYKD